MESQQINDEPMIKGYNHKPYIVPPGTEIFELCLINGKIRKAEWHEVKPKRPRVAFWKRLLIAAGFITPLPKPQPIKQLVEYDDHIYIPAQNLKQATEKFDRIFRMSNAKDKLKKIRK